MMNPVRGRAANSLRRLSHFARGYAAMQYVAISKVGFHYAIIRMGVEFSQLTAMGNATMGSLLAVLHMMAAGWGHRTSRCDGARPVGIDAFRLGCTDSLTREGALPAYRQRIVFTARWQARFIQRKAVGRDTRIVGD
jgi:hypothetical protein